jgi:hypothetical protein
MPKSRTPKPTARTNKQALVRQMLSRQGGASVQELAAATGWQLHSTRAALTGLRKTGLTITREKGDGVTRYHSIASA